MKKLQDRVAVVTGAASGIGRATSVALAREGCALAIADLNEAGLAQTADEVRALGRKVSLHRVDVSDKNRMQAFAAEVQAEHGAVHILINNAGVTVTSSFEEHSLEDWEWIVGINFWGVVYGCKFFLPELSRADEAHIVNISSIFGIIGVPTQTSYCATKFAVRGFSEALWTELREHNIGVTSVHPGGVRTNIAKSARAEAEDLKEQAVKLIARSSIPPERCAALIIEAIKADKMRQLVTKETHLIDTIKRFSPVLSQRMLLAGYRRMLPQGRS